MVKCSYGDNPELCSSSRLFYLQRISQGKKKRTIYCAHHLCSKLNTKLQEGPNERYVIGRIKKAPTAPIGKD
jgi:hypothetical protein